VLLAGAFALARCCRGLCNLFNGHNAPSFHYLLNGNNSILLCQ
jgi:hypothetical protein